MEIITLKYKAGTVPYIIKEEADQERVIELESHQRGIIGYVIESFAAHCNMLVQTSEFVAGQEFEIAVSDKFSVVKDEGKVYLCLPDYCLEEVGVLSRGNASDVASMNWYAYSSAKESVLDWVEIDADSSYKQKDHRSQAQELITEFEWRNIKKILSYAHLFDYPRPSNNRMGYLEDCGVTEVPLVLS